MNPSHNKNIYLAFPIIVFVISVLLLGGAWNIYVSSKSDIKVRQQAQSTSVVLKIIREIHVAILNAETGQRGYILTQNDSYLEPYRNGISQYQSSLGELKEGLSGRTTEPHIELILDIERLSIQKIEELSETISYVKSGDMEKVREITESNLGKSLMDQISQKIEAFYIIERGILDDTLTESSRSQRASFRKLIFMGLGGVVLLFSLLYLFIRSASLGKTKELLREVTEEKDRADLLSKEINHRVKNLFAIVTSIVRLTGRSETDTKLAIKKINDRILALSKAHSLTVTVKGNELTDLRSIIQIILAPYLTPQRTYKIDGPEIELSQKALTPLGLLLHEAATNAMKYGAWSQESGGHIGISWEISDVMSETRNKVKLLWKESSNVAVDIPETITSTGFGFRMMDMSMRQLGGHVERNWTDGVEMSAVFIIDRTMSEATEVEHVTS